jgi:acyl-homoserine lactone acylase PvdQ
MELLSNMSNNTVYADDKGNIAYWHGDLMPKRDTAYDWSQPVDGSVSATEWKGLHPLNEIVQVHNPASGFIQNCNSTPFTVSGASSPKRENYPAYMAPDAENFRAVNAQRLCSAAKDLTLDKLIQLGYNTYLTAFETLLPALFKAYDSLPATDSDRAVLQQAITVLKSWNLCADKESVATTLAVEWAQKLLPAIQAQKNVTGGLMERMNDFAQHANAATLLTPMKNVLAELTAKFGSADIAWGKINRYQRLTGNIDEVFDDNKESLPVGFVSSLWGCLPSFNSRYVQGSKKRYGFNGNSFVCAVEFGKKIKAKSLLTGGESGHKNTPHFNDQAEMYAEGKLKDVLFYKEDILKNAEAQYHPGEERR